MRALLPVLFLETACLPVVPAPYKCDLQDSAEPVADTATEEVEHIGGPVEEERAHIHAIYLESDGEILTDNVALDDKGQAHFGSLKLFVPPEGVEVTSTSIIGDDPGVTHIQHELTEPADIETEAELSGDFPVNGWTFPVNND